MIDRIIDFSVRNKAIVFIIVVVLCIAGWWSMKHVSLDAIPDLSETQVIIYSRWDLSLDIIEDQATYPIVTVLLGAPTATIWYLLRDAVFLMITGYLFWKTLIVTMRDPLQEDPQPAE
jgi:Cu/Ag efflux pump CusA